MAHTFEHTLDEWATNGTKSAPSSTLKSTGFVGGMKPPASVFNYQWDKIAKAISELQQYALTEDPSGGIWQNLAAVATSGNYNDLLNKPELKAVATSGNYADLTGAPTGFSVYNITTASYTNNKYSIPLTYSRYIYLLNGQAKSTKSSYSDISECTSFGFIIKDSTKILSWNFRVADSSHACYSEIEVNYDDLIYHQSSHFPTGTARVAQVSNNNLLFGAENISFFTADGGGPWTSPYNFIGTIYLMPV